MNIHDFEIFDQIMEKSKEIAILYNRLMQIEFMGNKLSSIYKNVLSSLEKKIIDENKLYDSLMLTNSKKQKLWNYLVTVNELNNVNLADDFAAACNDSVENLWFYRISNKMNDYTMSFIEQDVQFINMVRDSFGEEELERYLNETELINAVDSDFKRAVFYFMRDEIDNYEDEKLKDYLISVRYNLAYITPKCEDELLSNEFQNPKDLYFLFPFIGDYLGVDDDYKEDIQIGETYHSCIEAVESTLELLKYTNQDNGERIKRNCIVLSILFRAGLSISYNNDKYLNVSDSISTFIEEEKAYDIIEVYKEKVKSDQSKCKYLSMKK